MTDGVYAYVYEREKSFLLFLVNANYLTYPETEFELFNIKPKRIKLIRRDGTVKPIKYEQIERRIRLQEPLNYLSTMTLILEK